MFSQFLVFVNNSSGDLPVPDRESLRAMLQKVKARKKILTHILFVAACTFLVFCSFALWLRSGNSSVFRANLEDLITNELVSTNLPAPGITVDAIYVLGGSQNSLEFKFKIAAKLYHEEISKKIMILSRPGKTEYSSLLRRNLYNNEWAILKLEELGVHKKNVEFISIEKEFFGTHTEAKSISKLIMERGYKSIILISSPCHTRRVRISFKKFLEDDNVPIYVSGSGERASLRKLIIEFAKLKTYEYFLVS